jgi:CheY-like chemotaxis protein
VTDLTGKRILVVEDEALVAFMVADMLEEVGVVVVGPAGTVEEGLALVSSETLDGALLDVNLRGERIEPVAEALEALGVPFVFATGYGAMSGDRWPEALVVDKPYAIETVARTLARALEAVERRGD